jgi:uncharacterized protein (DUF1800 family)
VNRPIIRPLDLELAWKRRNELIEWWILEAYKDKTARERIVAFFSNHFVVEAKKFKSPQLLYKINELFRTFALGNLRELTKEVGKDPAMLIYLDGVQNTKKNLNENYGRELQELFTIGRGNYTQQDIVEASRSYTGWRIDHQHITSYLDPKRFDNGPKTFYGQTGNWGTDDIVDIIFTKNETAEFLARKIYANYVYHVPDEQIVSQLADLLIANDFNLAPVFEILFSSEHFMDDAFIGAEIKSPLEFMMGLLRQTNIVPRNFYRDVNLVLKNMGQATFNPPNVAGWEDHRAWINASLLTYRNGLIQLIFNNPSQRKYKFNYKAFIDSYPNPEDPYDLTSDILSDLLQVDASQEVEDALVDILLENRDPSRWKAHTLSGKEGVKKLLAAIMQMPEFQLT